MSHQGSEDYSTHPLDAFNNVNVPSLSSGSKEDSLKTSVSQEATHAQTLHRPEPAPTAKEAPSEGHALGQHHGPGGAPDDDDQQEKRRYPIEWERGITTQDNSEGPSNAAGTHEVSKWSSSSESTAAESSLSRLPVDTEELAEALRSTLNMAHGALAEPAVPEVEPVVPEAQSVDPRNKKERRFHTEYAKVRTKYFWRRVKALRKRATTFINDLLFYGIFDPPVHDPMVVNAEVIDGISVTESELREYLEGLNTPRPSPPIPVPSATEPSVPALEEQPVPQPERNVRFRVSSQAKKLGRKLLAAVKKIGKRD